MTVSAPHRIAQVIFSISSSMEERTTELPILALIFTRKLRPMAEGSISGWLMLAGMIARPACHFVPDEIRGQILAQGDEFHFRGDDPLFGIVHLGDSAAAAQNLAPGRRVSGIAVPRNGAVARLLFIVVPRAGSRICAAPEAPGADRRLHPDPYTDRKYHKLAHRRIALLPPIDVSSRSQLISCIGTRIPPGPSTYTFLVPGMECVVWRDRLPVVNLEPAGIVIRPPTSLARDYIILSQNHPSLTTQFRRRGPMRPITGKGARQPVVKVQSAARNGLAARIAAVERSGCRIECRR